MERHAFVVVVAVDGAVVVAEVQVVFVDVVAIVWQTDDFDLGWKNHLRHRTILNLCRMETVMGTVVKVPLALVLLFETLELIHLVPIIVIAMISPVDADRTRIENKKKIEKLC